MDADAAGRHIAESTAASVLNSPTKKYNRIDQPTFCTFCRGIDNADFESHT
jgi:hypothetical protein